MKTEEILCCKQRHCAHTDCQFHNCNAPYNIILTVSNMEKLNKTGQCKNYKQL